MTNFLRRTLTAVLIVAGLLTSTVHAEDKIYDGYGESHSSPFEKDDFAKMRADIAKVQELTAKQ